MGRKKLTIEEMHKLANRQNGNCLSKEYTDSKTKLQWQCEKGHIFLKAPSLVRQEKWCPICAKDSVVKKIIDKTFSKVKEIAKMKGGECLSNTYKNHFYYAIFCTNWTPFFLSY